MTVLGWRLHSVPLFACDGGGMRAMWLLIEGRSKTGSNLSGEGEAPTRQLWVAIPRVHNGNHNIVVFLLNAPAADYEQRVGDLTPMLKTLKVGGRQTDRQKAG